MADSRHVPPHAGGHRSRRHVGSRSVAVIAVVKLAIVVAVLALPSWFAISLGAAHGVALVAVAAAVMLTVGVRRSRRRAGERTVPAAEARIATASASRYLVRLCRHAARIGEHVRGGHAHPAVLGVEFSGTHGTLDLSWGRCVLRADPDALTVRVEAATEEHLRGIQDVIAADLERFGRRDALTVTWQRPAARVDETG